ncbi:hypothetical protein GQ55_6G189500 [Panicum hallii var. hallii]|uniref:Flavin-containing monooxygenase n=1 Tax=Panicum hallii var. hallii TaxID=1504633 RepID=A0A2T7D7B7_9POAL|nr:hypothetical protein GQ55_6G189500 [Panicum hallii var. hallii]
MDVKKNKRVAIVGAGPSGLAACKHALGKGFRPVVFESGAAVSGVWARTLSSTRLQTPASTFRFSDFPWPAGTAPEEFPRHDHVVAYMTAYARRFGVLERVRFGSTVLAAEYVGPSEREVAAWERWSGNGEAFGDGTGEWRLTVQHAGSEGTQTYEFDFLVLCVGRYGVAKVPKFPPGRGPEVFHGQVLHSMNYSRMAHADADELIRGKRVVVVGSGKSGLDTVAHCAEANGEHKETVIYRSAQWMVDTKLIWGGVSFGKLAMTRLAELMVHEPGEGFLLFLLATMLTPLRWLTATLAEAYLKMHIPFKKHGTVPECSFSQSILGWRLGTLPEGFYDMVSEGSVQIKRCDSFSFCANGLVLDGTGERVDADVVILATGFDADRLLRGVFVSPRFREIVASGDSDTMLPLYRHCVHPRIPQMAVVGYAESAASIYPYEMMAKWVAHLLDGAVRLPGVAAMERSVAEWERWGQWAERGSGAFFLKSCIATVTTWYHDQLCRDMGYSPRRKKGGGLVAEWLQPYGPTDYAGIQ